MQRSFPWFWLALLLLLLAAPGPAGRFLVNVLGGLTLLALTIPLLLGVAGWLLWRDVRRRATTCPRCGAVSLGAGVCGVCGTPLGESSIFFAAPQQAPSQQGPQTDAREATVDVEAREIEED